MLVLNSRVRGMYWKVLGNTLTPRGARSYGSSWGERCVPSDLADLGPDLEKCRLWIGFTFLVLSQQPGGRCSRFLAEKKAESVSFPDPFSKCPFSNFPPTYDCCQLAYISGPLVLQIPGGSANMAQVWPPDKASLTCLMGFRSLRTMFSLL